MSLEFNTQNREGNYIVDDIGKIVAMVRENWITMDSTLITMDSDVITVDGGKAPYYMYGHTIEVANRLLTKNKKFQKYPLVILVMDTPEEKDNGIVKFNLNIGLVAHTKPDYITDKRYEQVFKPILYPLYEKFMQAIKDSGLFFWEGDQSQPPHTKIDRPYWGTGGQGNQTAQKKNEKYIFNDELDCIEIVNLRINQTKNKI